MPNYQVTDYRILDARAPYKAVDRGIAAIAERLRAEVAARTPRDTGTMAGNWQVTTVRGMKGIRAVRNPTEYARFVEYGTRHMRARPEFGRAIARWRNRGGFK